MKVVAILAVIVATSSVAHAGVSLLRSERTVSTSINSPLGTGRRSDKPGKFDESVESHFIDTDGDGADAKTSQTSTIGDNFVSATGSFLASLGDDTILFRNSIDASFRVTTKTEYHLSVDLAFDEYEGPQGLDPLLTVRLRNVTKSTDLAHETYDDQTGFPFTFSSSGLLSPGDYELLFDLHKEAFRFENMATYHLDFMAGDADGNGGPPAVPLPPAVWTGLLTLAGLAGAMGYAARRSQLT